MYELKQIFFQPVLGNFGWPLDKGNRRHVIQVTPSHCQARRHGFTIGEIRKVEFGTYGIGNGVVMFHGGLGNGFNTKRFSDSHLEMLTRLKIQKHKHFMF